MMKKISCILTILFFCLFQTESSRGEPKKAEETQPPKMSEKEFFIAVQMPEYNDYTKKASELYNDNKYKESIEIAQKALDLYNEHYEEIKKGYEKYGATKDAQKKFECFPIFQYAIAQYADAAATEHGAHKIWERYFMILKAHKLFEYLSAMYPTEYRQKAYYDTTKQLLFNAKSKAKFSEEETKTYEELAKSYDFTKEEMRTIKNAVELINKVDKVAKEYKPKPEAPHREPVEKTAINEPTTPSSPPSQGGD